MMMQCFEMVQADGVGKSQLGWPRDQVDSGDIMGFVENAKG